MQGADDSLDAVLDGRLREISDQITSGTLGVSVYDYLSGLSWQFNGDRWFHAASVIKLAILVALYDAADQGRFSLGNRLHVRNRFMSVADGLPFRIDCSRDADAEVHAALGRTMQVRQSARRMIICARSRAASCACSTARSGRSLIPSLTRLRRTLSRADPVRGRRRTIVLRRTTTWDGRRRRRRQRSSDWACRVMNGSC
jgi:Beta-lactamase enzyme family